MGLGVHFQALGELLRRYGTGFRHAWQHRKELESPPRLPHEAQFLPAALSLQETPVSPAPRVAMWLLIVFACIALMWAIFGHIDVVATAQGKIVPNERSKTIQPVETAAVTAIHVTDGQTVKAGDLLIELDGTAPNADALRFENDLVEATLQSARAAAFLRGMDGGEPSLNAGALGSAGSREEPFLKEGASPNPSTKNFLNIDKYSMRESSGYSGATKQYFRSFRKGVRGTTLLQKGFPRKSSLSESPLVLAGVDDRRLGEARRMLDGQWREYRSKLERIEAEIARKEAELRSITQVVKKLEATVPIDRYRADVFKKLWDQDVVSEQQYLDKKRVLLEQEGDLAAQTEKLKEVRAGLEESMKQRAVLVAETRRTMLDSQREADQKVTVNQQELIKARQRGRLMKLAAPVDGSVQELAIHTVGGVVTPAQQLMVIVPKDDPLEVEAFIENKDIGFVDAGQDAEVKIETFQYTKYGTIRGQVKSVSGDAIKDEQRGLVYSSRVKLANATVQVERKVVNLTAGMAVTVEIKTGRRRVIEYFLTPLLQYGKESLRER
ncbi:MAG: HlyD family type I secretion periplasmic adaptor subunit [Thermodesulfobacteriota bacterium]